MDPYAACAFAKPLCTVTDEEMPGNRVESRASRTMSPSVSRGSLRACTGSDDAAAEQDGDAHLAGVCALVGHDDRLERGVEAHEPCGEAVQPREAKRGVRHRGRRTHSQNCTESPSPPDATGSKPGFASQLAPQVHASVAAGWQ